MQPADTRLPIANMPTMVRGGKGKKGIAKALAYVARVFCVEYDLFHMIIAYGAPFLHWLIDEIVAGRVNCKQDVERWSAFYAMNPSVPFEAVRESYGAEAKFYSRSIPTIAEMQNAKDAA